MYPSRLTWIFPRKSSVRLFQYCSQYVSVQRPLRWKWWTTWNWCSWWVNFVFEIAALGHQSINQAEARCRYFVMVIEHRFTRIKMIRIRDRCGKMEWGAWRKLEWSSNLRPESFIVCVIRNCSILAMDQTRLVLIDRLIDWFYCFNWSIVRFDWLGAFHWHGFLSLF